jgi:hypothetical protein
MVFLKDLEEGQSVHPRHFQVQRDDIRLKLQDSLAGLVSLCGAANHLDFGIS